MPRHRRGLRGAGYRVPLLRNAVLIASSRDPSWARGSQVVSWSPLPLAAVPRPRRNNVSQKARDGLVAMIPVGRIGVPEDIWLAVKFVIECDYFSGETIDVHGGLAM